MAIEAAEGIYPCFLFLPVSLMGITNAAAKRQDAAMKTKCGTVV
jgi:hypothetical protein